MLIIDRIEGDIVTCETDDDEIVNLDVRSLPETFCEGDVLVPAEEEGRFVVDVIATKLRRDRINAKLRRLTQ